MGYGNAKVEPIGAVSYIYLVAIFIVYASCGCACRRQDRPKYVQRWAGGDIHRVGGFTSDKGVRYMSGPRWKSYEDCIVDLRRTAGYLFGSMSRRIHQ